MAVLLQKGALFLQCNFIWQAFLVPVSYYLLPIVKCLSTETLSLSSSVDSRLSSPQASLGEPFIKAERSAHKAAELWLRLKLEKFTGLKVGLVRGTA